VIWKNYVRLYLKKGQRHPTAWQELRVDPPTSHKKKPAAPYRLARITSGSFHPVYKKKKAGDLASAPYERKKASDLVIIK